jgi:hypothetical protein
LALFDEDRKCQREMDIPNAGMLEEDCCSSVTATLLEYEVRSSAKPTSLAPQLPADVRVIPVRGARQAFWSFYDLN